MVWKRTPEMTRQVKNIVDALNHKRERMIAEGNYWHIPPKLKKSTVWKMIETADNPQEAYDRLVGTTENPGSLRKALPSIANREGLYRPKLNSQGESYAPASQLIDEAFHDEAALKRNKNLDSQRKQKEMKYDEYDYMDEDEFEGLMDGLSKQGGALSEEELPDYGTYDSGKYWEFSANIGDVDYYIDTYMDAWAKYGFFSNTAELTNIFNDIKKYNPMKLVDVFNSGAEEVDVDFLYNIYKALMQSQRNKKGTSRRGYVSYINGIERIMRFWRKIHKEVLDEIQ